MSDYTHRRATLIAYLKVKTDEGDWHGVSDAANDLRVLEAAQSREFLEDLNQVTSSIDARQR